MADRNTIHFSHLDRFKRWLVKDGYELLPLSNNPYEVLRAKKGEDWLILYKRFGAKEHYTYMDKNWKTVRRFLNEVKNERTCKGNEDAEVVCGLSVYNM